MEISYYFKEFCDNKMNSWCDNEWTAGVIMKEQLVKNFHKCY